MQEFSRNSPPWLCAVRSAHHFYNFNQLVSVLLPKAKKVTNVHLVDVKNPKTLKFMRK